MNKIIKLKNWVKDQVDDIPGPDDISNENLTMQYLLGNLLALGIILIGIIVFSILILLTPIVAIIDFLGYIAEKFNKINPLKEAIKHCENKFRIEGSYYLVRVSNNEVFEIPSTTTLGHFVCNLLSHNNYNAYCYTYCNGLEICDPDKRRSLGDIYLICKHYFPNCTPIDVLKSIINSIAKGYIYGCYCNTIHKFVFTRGEGRLILSNSVTEYGCRFIDVINEIKKMK